VRNDRGNEKFVITAYPVFDAETFQMLYRGVTGVHIRLLMLMGKVAQGAHRPLD
jgi:hypothetical protein